MDQSEGKSNQNIPHPIITDGPPIPKLIKDNPQSIIKMSNEKDKDTSNQLEDEPAKKLPKLVKDKIDDYNYHQYIERENKSLEEMYIKCVNAIHSVSHAEVCCGYDLIHGRRKYCMRMDIGRYNSSEIYSCDICHDPDKFYCIDHVKNKLFNVHHNECSAIVCNECIDQEYSEDDSVYDID